MLLRTGRFGEFLGCSGYPECKTIVNPKKEEKPLGVPCPVPGCTGELTEKRSRRGKIFYGCNRYPECSFATWDKPTEERCDACGYPKGERVFRGRKLGLRCVNKECPTNATNGKEEGLPTVTEERPARTTAAAARTKSAGKSTAAKTTAKAGASKNGAKSKATAGKSAASKSKAKSTAKKSA
jgi:DNA topoisomerase-1